MDGAIRSFGYLCPQCGRPVQETRTAFALEASENKISCECGKSVLHITFDGRLFHLEVPCGSCGAVHHGACPPERVYHGPDLALSCPQTGQFCCFIGSADVVAKRLQELERLTSGEQQSDHREIFSDNALMYDILSELKEIASRKDGITCQCGSRDYSMEIRRSWIDLICRQCGSKLRIPAGSSEDLTQLCCRYHLVIHGKQNEPERGAGNDYTFS